MMNLMMMMILEMLKIKKVKQVKMEKIKRIMNNHLFNVIFFTKSKNNGLKRFIIRYCHVVQVFFYLLPFF